MRRIEPAVTIRVRLLDADGAVRARHELCWAQPPPAADVIDALARRAPLVIEQAPDWLVSLLVLAGLDDLGRQPE